MQISTNIIINGSKGKPIGLDVFYKETGKPKAIVIFVHGFKGFKDWGHFNEIAKTFAEEDFVFVKFNFSYNGTTPNNPLVFDDLEAFGNNNYIIELDDLGLVIDWISKNESLANDINPENINLIGHSRGGGIVVLKAAEDKRITKITTWAGVSDFINRNNQNTIKLWKEKGVVHTYNMRTKQQMPLYYQFYETIQNNKERLNIVKAAKQLTIPFLIIHGTADNAVSINDAEELNRACKQSELLVIENGNHTFGVKHPFNSSVFPEQANLVIQHTLEFFKK
jgi:alpha-beta hydrolase superfamily lysophospholipase